MWAHDMMRIKFLLEACFDVAQYPYLSLCVFYLTAQSEDGCPMNDGHKAKLVGQA